MDAGVLFCGTPDEVHDQIVDFCRHCGGMGNLLMMGQGGELTHAQTVDNLDAVCPRSLSAAERVQAAGR